MARRLWKKGPTLDIVAVKGVSQNAEASNVAGCWAGIGHGESLTIE